MKYIEFRTKRGAKASEYISRLFGISTARVKSLFSDGDVRIEGKRTKIDLSVKTGDKIGFYINEREYERFCFREVYRDDNVIFIDKPVFVESSGDFSCEERLSAILGIEVKACHRLDTNTTGLNAFALNDKSEREMLEAFREKRVFKTYHAWVFGKPEKTARLKDFLFKDAKKNRCFVSAVPQRGAREIVTDYTLVAKDGQSSLLEVHPVTGRTHQIRAHLSFHGLPVVGDGKYGDFSLNKKCGFSTQRLRCVAMSFDFPPSSPMFYLSGKNFSCE